jgi:hypothetical protein
MYVPRHQYVIKTLTDTGGRIQFEDGTPFQKSSYIEMSNGDMYDVPSDDLKKGDFTRARKLVSTFLPIVVGTGLSLLRSFIAKKKAGQKSIQRYFLRHKPANQVIEISEEDYKEELKNPVSHKQVIALPWIIAGPVEDYEVSGYRYEGVITKNKRTVEQASQVVTNLSQYITDYSFLADDIGKYQALIEKQPDQFYIPSPSRRVGN